MHVCQIQKLLFPLRKYIGIILLGAGIVGVLFGGIVCFKKSRKLQAQKAILMAKHSHLLRVRPQIEQEDLELMNLYYQEQCERYREESRAFFKERLQSFGSREPAALLFELKAFVERMHHMAQKKGVEVARDNCFGFDVLISRGALPSSSEVEMLYNQKQILSNLLEMLFQSSPKSLLSIAFQGIEPFEGSGQFIPSLDPEIESYRFKIEFEGYTQSLRLFLNYLQETAFPITVRNVEIRPSLIQKDLKYAKKKETEIVLSQPSVFSVTLEWSQFFKDTPAQISEIINTSGELVFPPHQEQSTPRSQELENQCIYDLFTAPQVELDTITGALLVSYPYKESAQTIERQITCANKPLYRIQFFGYSDEKDPCLWLFNEENKTLMKGKVGQEFEQEAFLIRSFVPQHVSNEGDSVAGATVELWDKRINKQMTLSTYSPASEDVE